MAAEPRNFKEALAAFDWKSAKSKDFLRLVAVYDAETASGPRPGPLNLKNGWHTIGRKEAIDLLRRNRPGANRKIDWQTVFYYTHQMVEDEWKPTGQPIIFDTDGVLLDAQHRLWALLLSGATITTYIVTDTPAQEQLFAYIDNGRVRNASAALETAGFNGSSSTVAALITIGEGIRGGFYTASRVATMDRLAPIEYLRAVDRYPNAQRASRSAGSDWKIAIKLLDMSKSAACFVGMRIIDIFGDERADEFFEDVVRVWRDAQEAEEDAREAGVRVAPKPYPLPPLEALYKVLREDAQRGPNQPQLKKHQRMGLLIKAFNAWERGEPLKARWSLMVNEAFPDFVAPIADAAE